MDYQYVPPVPRVHRVTISGQLKTYSDLWIEEDRDTRLAPVVLDWLAENASRAKVICDRGDWGEGTPVFYIDFGSEAQARAFMAEFARPEALDLELRSGRFYTTMYDGLVVDMRGERGNIRIIANDAIQFLRDIGASSRVSINSDDEGEYVDIVFSTAEARVKFGHYAWKTYHWRETLRKRTETEAK